MGGIQSKHALPDDTIFKQRDNPYDVASYKIICGEFGIDPSTDFRFTYGQNHGLGYVSIRTPKGLMPKRSGNTPQLTCQTRQAKGVQMRVEQRMPETE